MRRKIKKVDKCKRGFGTRYQFIIEATPTWYEKILGHERRNEFYIGYGSIWYRNYFGDIELVSDTKLVSRGYKERCSSIMEMWLANKFAQMGLSLNKKY